MSILPFLRLFFPSIIKNFVGIYRFAVFAVLFSGTILVYTSLNQKQKEVEEILTNSSDQIRKIVSYDIDYVKYQLFYASSQISGMKENNRNIYKLLSTFLTNVNNQVDVALTWNAFSWIDKNDRIIIDGTSGILTKPVDVSDRDYLKFTPNSYNKIIFGKPVYGALSQRFLIPAGIGTFSPTGKYLGTLVFGFDIEKIVNKVGKTLDNKNISFAFLQEGDFLFGSENFNRDYYEIIKDKIKLISLDDSIEKKRISKQKIVFGNGINAYFQRIRGYPIEFVMFYDDKTYHRETIDILFKQMVLVFVILFACLILFRTIYMRIVRPVTKLSNFAEKISQKDYSYEIERPESKELEELYSALKMLRDSFKREEKLVDQLKTANQKIAQENFNKSEFLSAISHDIRNPLAAIHSFVHMLRNKEGVNEDDMLNEIENCANDAMQFINDLMDVTQVSSGVFSINMSQKVNLHEMIRRSIRVNKDFAGKKQIKLINSSNVKIPEINLDQRRIKQILINLISNSIKYSRDNTNVEIGAENFEENGRKKLRIFVKDEGMGMSQEQIKKATKKFGLASENQNTARLDSFGIGLSLVKQLVELQNGEIKIESKIGLGTNITICFNYLE